MDLQKKEYRSSEVNVGEDLILVGVPAVFGQKTLIHDRGGDFYEVIDRHAFDECDLDDSTLRTEHETGSLPLARSPRTMQLTIEEDGLHMRAELAGTERGRETYEAVRRRDISGMSMGFVVAPGGSRYDAATNTRRITKIATLYEVSLTASPAYQGTSVSVEARSQIEHARQAEDERRQLLVQANKIILNI